MSIARRVKLKSSWGKNSRGLAKYDQHSSSIGLVDALFCQRDQQIQVTDLVDVNGLGLSEVMGQRRLVYRKIGILGCESQGKVSTANPIEVIVHRR